MPQQIFYPNSGLLAQTTVMKANLDAGKIRLFKSPFTPNITTTKDELVAQEADYTGYPAGGLAIATWAGPFLAPEGGMAIQTPTLNFVTAAPYTVPNLIGGYWIENGDEEVMVIAEFAQPQPMQVAFQVLNLQSRLVFPN